MGAVTVGHQCHLAFPHDRGPSVGTAVDRLWHPPSPTASPSLQDGIPPLFAHEPQNAPAPPPQPQSMPHPLLHRAHWPQPRHTEPHKNAVHSIPSPTPGLSAHLHVRGSDRRRSLGSALYLSKKRKQHKRQLVPAPTVRFAHTHATPSLKLCAFRVSAIPYRGRGGD